MCALGAIKPERAIGGNPVRNMAGSLAMDKVAGDGVLDAVAA